MKLIVYLVGNNLGVVMITQWLLLFTEDSHYWVWNVVLSALTGKALKYEQCIDETRITLISWQINYCILGQRPPTLKADKIQGYLHEKKAIHYSHILIREMSFLWIKNGNCMPHTQWYR